MTSKVGAASFKKNQDLPIVYKLLQQDVASQVSLQSLFFTRRHFERANKCVTRYYAGHEKDRLYVHNMEDGGVDNTATETVQSTRWAQLRYLSALRF